jgi:hypothetical protein
MAAGWSATDMDIASLLENPVASEIYAAWRNRIVATEPISAESARSAIYALYDALRVARPNAVLFVASPMQAVLALRLIASTSLIELSHQNSGLVAKKLTALVAAAPNGGVGSSVRALAGQIIMDPIRAALDDHHLVEADRADRTAIASIIRSQTSLNIKPRWPRAGSGPVKWDAFDLSASMGALAQLAFWQETLSAFVSTTSTPFVTALGDVCRTCGWSVMLDKVAVVSDRPVTISVQSLEMRASRAGAMHSYRDGFQIRAHQGVLLPAWLIASPHRVTVQHIERENNLEMRRLLLEAMGIERYLSKSKAKKIAQDETGILWQRALSTRQQEWRPELQPMTFVEVKNGTREPDGRFKRYFLRVPPWVQSAREAVGWTYGLSEEEYQPTLRT